MNTQSTNQKEEMPIDRTEKIVRKGDIPIETLNQQAKKLATQMAKEGAGQPKH